MMFDLDTPLLIPFLGRADSTYASVFGRQPARIARQESELHPNISETLEHLCRTVPELPGRPKVLPVLLDVARRRTYRCDLPRISGGLALGGLKLGDADIENADRP